METRSDQVLEPIGLVEGDHGVFDGDGSLFAELAESACYGLTRGAGHRGHLFVGEEQRKTVVAVYVFADLVGEFEKETTKAACDGFGEGDAARVLQGEAILLAYALHRAHLGFAMVAEKGQESFAFDGAQLCGGERLCRDFIDAVGEGCVESEDGSGTRNADDHLAVLGAAGSELEISSANQIETAGILTLAEESGLGWKADGTRNELKVGQNRASERAEPSRSAIGACCTADRRLTTDALLPSRCSRDDSQVRHFLAFHTVCRS